MYCLNLAPVIRMRNPTYKICILGSLVLVLGGGFWLYPRQFHFTSEQHRSSIQVSVLPEAKIPETVELKNGDTYNLTAGMVKKTIAGHEVTMLAYNGSIPGPIIKVAKGAEVTINFTNKTDVPTTLHSHGVRLNNQFDGVPNATEKEVGIGESFRYKLIFPDEGVYWYHPHVHEDYAQESGLYGNYIVEPTDASYWSKVNEEIPLMVDDILLQDGRIPPFSTVTDHALMGRYGNVMLVNGTDHYRRQVKKGEVVRFYVTNAANTRVFNLQIPGVKLKLVGSDNGRYEKETFVDTVLLAPSKRAVVEAFFDTPGTYSLEHTTPLKTYTMGTITVLPDTALPSYAGEFHTLRTSDAIRKEIPNLDTYFGKPADKKISLRVEMGSMHASGSHMMPNGQMMGSGGSHMMQDAPTSGNDSMMMGGSSTEKIEWEDSMGTMNALSDSKMVTWKIIDQETGKANHDIHWNFKKGDLVKIKIYNDPTSMHPMQHPIHFHGQRFLVLSTNGIHNDNFAWKDTTLVQEGDTVEILVEMQNPGMWMAHCHIAEHLESGMMFDFTVE